MSKYILYSLFILLGFTKNILGNEKTLLHCGHIFDSKNAKLLGQHSILIEKNIIISISPGITSTGVKAIIDLLDHTCLPGFMDLHVHLSHESNPNEQLEHFRLDDVDFAYRSVGYAAKTLKAGFTTVRDLGGKIVIKLRNAINAGLIQGPRIFAAGVALHSTGGHADPTNGWNNHLSSLAGPTTPTEGTINSIEDARRAVRQRYKETSDWIKITSTGGVLSYAKSGIAPQFSMEELNTIMETAKEYGLKVAAHAHGYEGMKRAILAGVHTIDHGTEMNDELFKLMKKHGTWHVPTLAAGKFVGDKAKIEGYYPEIIRVKAATIGPIMQHTLKRSFKAGVKIAFGTDSGVGPHGENAQEFELLTQAGMPANIALQTATYNAALVLGIEKELGVLENGFKADIIAIKGNPIENISLTKTVNFVMKDGQVITKL